MSEIDEIKLRYEERKKFVRPASVSDFYFNWYIQNERELQYAITLKKKFGNNFSDLKIIEVGAGTGNNLFFFKKLGFQDHNIWANELLQDRIEILRNNFPGVNIMEGDASELSFIEKFDIVFQSTVFTSILDIEFRKKLADKMIEMLKPQGIVLWYDFMYDNPGNKHVKRVSRQEIQSLFPKSKQIEFYKVTLAPPISRRIYKFYPCINSLFPFLRTHVIAVIRKNYETINGR
jgi:SAM-dependent methyltransferase